MPTIKDLLLELVDDSAFKKYHFEGPYHGYLDFTPAQLKSDIERFLLATNDAVRLRRADDAAEQILSLVDCQDLMFLRKAVLRRELSRDIDYKFQRDHAAHTLNNYLLGWLLVTKCPSIREPLSAEFKNRLGKTGRPFEDDLFYQYFGHTWQFASLLHDIGYICEGALTTLDTEVQNERVARGASVIHDYFNHRFWVDIEGDSEDARTAVKSLNCPQVPDFQKTSVVSLGDVLCNIGDVAAIMALAAKELETLGASLKDVKEVANKSSDAFELWDRHYRFYGQSKMATLVRSLKAAYKYMAYDGLTYERVRMLDHGVVSGLLILQYATLHDRLYASLETKDEDNLPLLEKRIWNLIAYMGVPEFGTDKPPSSEKKKKLQHGFGAHFWWTCLVWASAAVAAHNLLQIKRPWPGTPDTIDTKLEMGTDPLAYLGVLVDCLQEWDRYDVAPVSALTGPELPLQSTDVEVKIGSPCVVTFRGMTNDNLGKLQDTLTRALGNSWRAFVEVRNC